MLKLLGSDALAKLLGFGLFGAIIIYALLSMLISRHREPRWISIRWLTIR
jgi:hypothetical protein